MSKLDSNFKKETDNEFRELDYVSKKLGLRILIVVVIISVLSAIGSVAYKKWKTDKNREIFKNSVTYTESAASFLADSYMQYTEAETAEDKTAIMRYVIMRYPNLDANDIDNVTLKQFYNKCLLGGN